MSSFQDLFSLAGKTAVVTGGTRGIGQAMALAFAEAGADVILIQRDDTNKTTYDQIKQLGRQAFIHTADLADPKSVKSVIAELTKAGHDMHILLNCAGVQKRHAPHQFPDEDWDFVLQVNLNTVWTLCRDFGAYLLSKPKPSKGSRGSIINIASLLTFQGGINVPAYAASKGGVGQLSKALSNQWIGEGIKVNCIAPGYIDTDMNEALMKDQARQKSILERIPAGRWGKPEDFKGPAIFLASEASGYVSGDCLLVDGGWMGR
ncbi:2-dehydro-3-deoxy-D-gluconate 5-dehydrogenase [Cyphellophora attinorum]|uniref:2-dehydro-3-deoxy-D-gluconate 5-dehydrogenase n=1 Tax=Cyphellophora attinorum TaxID=1664694 RepID=A0A0N0NQU5_9EURO|nr:2-dehydro-3-deoxy-D-gluconate 5-dehydrogenase [Phialophora attinorum]KPI44079.1 2-dehydro-3-deoxy-D-gluconate 5-dehydrogenase [Phialophora attinorum]